MAPAKFHIGSKPSSLRFVAVVALPMLIAGIVAWLQTSNLIHELTQISERADYGRSQNLIQSAFNAYRTKLEDLTADNAYWDEAARNVNVELDLEWIKDTWPTSDDVPNLIYNMVMVVDGGTSKVVAVSRNGKEPKLTVFDVFGDKWPKFLEALPDDPNRFQVVSAFLKTDRGAAVVAVAPIVSGDKELATTRLRPHYLVLLRDLDSALVKKLGDQYIVSELSMDTRPQTSHGTVVVSDEFGFFSPEFSWLTNEEAFARTWQLWDRALKTLGATFLVFLGIGIAYWRLMRKLQQSEIKAVHASFHDTLTGLGNRAAFNQRLNQLTSGENWNCSVAFADLDGFKAVNDTFGHDAGDLLLEKVAGTILKTVGSSHNVFRLGGDEFVVLFAGENPEAAAKTYATNLIQALRLPIDLGNTTATVGVSIGISYSNSESDELLRDADQAMYHAKKHGSYSFVEFKNIVADPEASLLEFKRFSDGLRDQERPTPTKNTRSSAAKIKSY